MKAPPRNRLVALLGLVIPLSGCHGVARLLGEPTTRQESYDSTSPLTFPAVQVFQGTLTAATHTVYVGEPTVLSIIVKVRSSGWVYTTLNETEYNVFENTVSFHGVSYPTLYWIQVTRTDKGNIK